MSRKRTPPLLLSARAVSIARRALEELDEGEVGSHIGVAALGNNSATHCFEAAVPGYPGWEWNVVVAAAPGSRWVTISELGLVSGGEALKAPEWVPYHDRVQPGDLGPGDLMPPAPSDPRLSDNDTESVLLTGQAIAPGQRKLAAIELETMKQRWHKGEWGPDTEYAQKAPHPCRSCAFYLPFAHPLGPDFGVCANEYSAHDQVVAKDYGCGAHSGVETPQTQKRVETPAFDDESLVEVEVRT
ncbi:MULTISPECIES: DUF3027 domain-containing protein [unclassified Corynebacterium]|uniref:DUF3027 domain-containing protein n=1 Tax=unclassified Corynebacterium TaxID=2624378 RepID=UPI00216911C6|nr:MULTISPECIES: DUF3027 domain-containing protein [unclassified Corynebacterium]MCS4490059.1 DUF3027 domain-containing protein [Corynebacterium sp. ES2775-CONJ]MCS4531683.1 DUF3027 domain-containing protein [Corynebacterium sp. ES2730-CONJ]